MIKNNARNDGKRDEQRRATVDGRLMRRRLLRQWREVCGRRGGASVTVLRTTVTTRSNRDTATTWPPKNYLGEKFRKRRDGWPRIFKNSTKTV